VLLDGTLDKPFFPRIQGMDPGQEGYFQSESVKRLAWGEAGSRSVDDCYEDEEENEDADRLMRERDGTYLASQRRITDADLGTVVQRAAGSTETKRSKAAAANSAAAAAAAAAAADAKNLLWNFPYKLEVTYDVFETKLWPDIKKEAALMNLSHIEPLLLWSEIQSLIKGSFEAVTNELGRLNLDEYEALGLKRAGNFKGCRKPIYHLFELYEKFKRQAFGFDNCDFVFHIYRELGRKAASLRAPTHRGYSGAPIHEVYVDEIQDFMESEVLLLICIARNPNKLFLTGDSCQTIARGLHFRFSDIRSVFKKANTMAQAFGGKLDERFLVQPTGKIKTLTKNYRTSKNSYSSLDRPPVALYVYSPTLNALRCRNLLLSTSLSTFQTASRTSRLASSALMGL